MYFESEMILLGKKDIAQSSPNSAQQHSLKTCQRIGQKATEQINHQIYAQLEATKLCWDVSQGVVPG